MAGIFAKRPVSQMAPALTGLQLQTSCWGRIVPLIYGMQRVAPNLIWYGDFTPIANTTKQGGKGGSGGGKSTTYTYKTGVSLALCEGTVSGIDRAWAGKDQTTLAALNLTLFTGALGQAAPAFMTTNHPTEALGYSGLAYLFTSAYDLGSSSGLPSHSFEVKGRFFDTGLAGWSDAALDLVVADLMATAGVPSSLYASMTAMASYCKSLGLWASPEYTEQAPASQYIEKLLEIGNIGLIASDGIFKFVPYADAAVAGNGASYTPTLTVAYDLTDDDFLHAEGEDPIRVSRTDPTDAPNQLTLQFKDRTNSYATNSATVEDPAAVALFGARPAGDQTFDEIAHPATAQMVATLRLQRLMSGRNTYRFRLGENYCLLEPMVDLVRLTESTGTGLDRVVVRITRVVETADHELDIEAEDFTGTVGTAPAYTYQAPGGYVVDYNADPGDISPPLIFDAPYELAESGFELWLAVAGADPLWGGCTVWMSTDNASYKQIGDITGPARYGRLAAAAGVGADPDTTSVVLVDLSASGGELTGGTTTDADNATTLCVMGREVFSYQAATLIGPNLYSLGSYLRRGLYGSARAAHAASEPFARIDSSVINVPYEKASIGSNIFFKFTSYNVWEGGQQDLASVTSYAYTIRGPIGGIPGANSLLDTKSWLVGTVDSQGAYQDAFDGSNHDSSIVLAGTSGNPQGPGGRIVPLWKCVGTGTTYNGGWVNRRDLFGIDPKKSYRSSVWFFWNGTGNPLVFHGPDGINTTQLDGTITSDPFFWYGGLSTLGLEPNRWYLLVGVIHGSDYGTDSSKVSGCYDSYTGRKIPFGRGDDAGGTVAGDNYGGEFRWRSDRLVPGGAQRAMQFAANNSGSIVWFADPRFDELNSLEPSIAALVVPSSGDSGIGAPIVPDSEFSAATDQTYWLPFGIVAQILATGGELGGYAKFANPGGVALLGGLYALRKPDNVLLRGKKIAVVVRYRRVGSLSMVSGQSSVSIQALFGCYNTPGNPLVGGNGGPNQKDLYTPGGGQLVANNTWLTETFIYDLTNLAAGTPYKYFAVGIAVAGLGSSGEVHVDTVDAFQTT